MSSQENEHTIVCLLGMDSGMGDSRILGEIQAVCQ